MDSTHLMYFKAIAETQNMRQASKQLFISQPALSKSLASLEKELGCSLFDRRNGRLVLNVHGQELLRQTKQMELIFDNISTYFQNQRDSIRPLSIYSIDSSYSYFIKNYFSYDSKPIRLKSMPRDMLLEAFRSGEADAVIIDSGSVSSGLGRELKQIHLLDEQLMLIVPKTHPLSSLKQIDIHDLTGYRFMHRISNQWLPEILEKNKVQLNIHWAVDADTWNYCRSNMSDVMPLYLESSAFFSSHEQTSSLGKSYSVLRVTGEYTSRMIFLLYFAANQDRLKDFIDSVKPM